MASLLHDHIEEILYNYINSCINIYTLSSRISNVVAHCSEGRSFPIELLYTCDLWSAFFTMQVALRGYCQGLLKLQACLILKIEDRSRSVGQSEHLYAPEIVSRLNQPGVCLNSQVMTMDIGSEAA